MALWEKCKWKRRLRRAELRQWLTCSHLVPVATDTRMGGDFVLWLFPCPFQKGYESFNPCRSCFTIQFTTWRHTKILCTLLPQLKNRSFLARVSTFTQEHSQIYRQLYLTSYASNYYMQSCNSKINSCATASQRFEYKGTVKGALLLLILHYLFAPYQL